MQVEQLKPTKLSNGAMFVFNVAIDDEKYDEIKQRFEQLIQDDILIKVLIYKKSHERTLIHKHVSVCLCYLIFVLIFSCVGI